MGKLNLLAPEETSRNRFGDYWSYWTSRTTGKTPDQEPPRFGSHAKHVRLDAKPCKPRPSQSAPKKVPQCKTPRDLRVKRCKLKGIKAEASRLAKLQEPLADAGIYGQRTGHKSHLFNQRFVGSVRFPTPQSDEEIALHRELTIRRKVDKLLAQHERFCTRQDSRNRLKRLRGGISARTKELVKAGNTEDDAEVKALAEFSARLAKQDGRQGKWIAGAKPSFDVSNLLATVQPPKRQATVTRKFDPSTAFVVRVVCRVMRKLCTVEIPQSWEDRKVLPCASDWTGRKPRSQNTELLLVPLPLPKKGESAILGKTSVTGYREQIKLTQSKTAAAGMDQTVQALAIRGSERTVMILPPTGYGYIERRVLVSDSQARKDEHSRIQAVLDPAALNDVGEPVAMCPWNHPAA